MFSSEVTDASDLSEAFRELKVTFDNSQAKISQETIQDKAVFLHVEQVLTTIYLCKYCKKKFSKFDEARILEHVNTKHANSNQSSSNCSDKGEIYPCKICDRKFSVESELRQHEDDYHKRVQRRKKKKNVACKLCNRKFSRERYLRDHEIAKHDPNTQQEKKENLTGVYPCKLCNKTFSKVLHLKQHEIGMHEKKKNKNELRQNELTGAEVRPFDLGSLFQ